MIMEHETAISRRNLITALAAVTAISAAGPALAGEGAIGVDPWRGRALESWERMRLESLGERIKMRLWDTDLEPVMLDNHLRLSLPQSEFFTPGKTDVSHQGAALLTLVAEAVDEIRLVRCELVGHSNPMPSSYEAYMLTRRRAMSALSVLTSRGIHESRLKATGLGSKWMRYAEGDKRNERIDMLFRPL